MRFDNKELSSLSPKEIAEIIGYLGHDPELSSDTIKNNILCGDDFDLIPYLEATDLKDEVFAMGNGLDTMVGNNGVRLSGGQAKRMALARTLAHPRPVMILDDPFSALDRKTEDIIFKNLQTYAKDTVVFLISHKLYHFSQMQKIIFMENGTITIGTHDELMKNISAYQRLYNSQTGGNHHENQT